MHTSIANSNQLVEKVNKDVIETKNNTEELVAPIKNELDGELVKINKNMNRQLNNSDGNQRGS